MRQKRVRKTTLPAIRLLRSEGAKSYSRGRGIVGFNLFYDQGRYGHQRAGAGIDFQASRTLLGANYYHPLSGVKTGYRGSLEQALQGADLVFEQGVAERMEFRLRVGRWKLKEKDARFIGTTKNSLRTQLRYRVSRVVSVWGGYDSYDKGLGAESSGRMGVDFALPSGAGVGGGERSPYLWRPVSRESRIFVERRSDRGSGLSLATDGEESLYVSEPADETAYPFSIKIAEPYKEERVVRVRIERSENLEKKEYDFEIAGTNYSVTQEAQSDTQREEAEFTPSPDGDPGGRDGGDLKIPAGAREVIFDLTIKGDEVAEDEEMLTFEVFMLPEEDVETYEPPESKIARAKVTVGPSAMEIRIDPDAEGVAESSHTVESSEPLYGQVRHHRVVLNFTPAVRTSLRVDITATGDLGEDEFVLERSDVQPGGTDVDTVVFARAEVADGAWGKDDGWVLVAPHGVREVWLSLNVTGDLEEETSDETLTLTATTDTEPPNEGTATLTISDTPLSALPNGVYLTVNHQTDITIDEPFHPDSGIAETESYEVEFFIKPELGVKSFYAFDLSEEDDVLRRPKDEEFEFDDDSIPASVGKYEDGILTLKARQQMAAFTFTIKSDHFAEDAEKLIIKASTLQANANGNKPATDSAGVAIPATDSKGNPIEVRATVTIRKSQHRIAANIHDIIREVEVDGADEEEKKVTTTVSDTTLQITEASLLACPDGHKCEDLIEDRVPGDGPDKITLELLEGRLEKVIEAGNEINVQAEITLRLCQPQATPAPCPNFGNDGKASRADLTFQYLDGTPITVGANNEFTVSFDADKDPHIRAIATSDTEVEALEQFVLTVIKAEITPKEVKNFFKIIEDQRNRLMMRIPANDGTITLSPPQKLATQPVSLPEETSGQQALQQSTGPYTVSLQESEGGSAESAEITITIDPIADPGGLKIPLSIIPSPGPNSGNYQLRESEYEISTKEIHSDINTAGTDPKQDKDDPEMYTLTLPWRARAAVLTVKVIADDDPDDDETLGLTVKGLGNAYSSDESKNKLTATIPNNDNLVSIEVVTPNKIEVTNNSKKKYQIKMRLTRTQDTSHVEVIPVKVTKTFIDEDTGVRTAGTFDASLTGTMAIFTSGDSDAQGDTPYEVVIRDSGKTLYLLIPFSSLEKEEIQYLILEDANPFGLGDLPFELKFEVQADTDITLGDANGDTKIPSTVATPFRGNTASPYKPHPTGGRASTKITTFDASSVSMALDGGGNSATVAEAGADVEQAIKLIIESSVTIPEKGLDLEVNITHQDAIQEQDFTVRKQGGQEQQGIQTLTFTTDDFTETTEDGDRIATFFHITKADDFAEAGGTITYSPQYKVTDTDGTEKTFKFSAESTVQITIPASDNDMTIALRRAADGSAVSGNAETITERQGSGKVEIGYIARITVEHPPRGVTNPQVKLLIGGDSADREFTAMINKHYKLNRSSVTGGTLGAPDANSRYLLTFAPTTDSVTGETKYEMEIPFTIVNKNDNNGDDTFFHIKLKILGAEKALYMLKPMPVLITIDDQT